MQTCTEFTAVNNISDFAFYFTPTPSCWNINILLKAWNTSRNKRYSHTDIGDDTESAKECCTGW